MLAKVGPRGRAPDSEVRVQLCSTAGAFPCHAAGLTAGRGRAKVEKLAGKQIRSGQSVVITATGENTEKSKPTTASYEVS